MSPFSSSPDNPIRVLDLCVEMFPVFFQCSSAPCAAVQIIVGIVFLIFDATSPQNVVVLPSIF